MAPPPETGLISVAEAVGRLAVWAPVHETENLPLAATVTRVLAEDVVASVALPGRDNSAMDGYAFNFADLPRDRRLPIVGRVAAGHPSDRAIPPAAAMQIFTGAIIPPGADTVAIQERCIVAGDVVTLAADVVRGANVRRAGEDVACGSTVLRSGRRLRPQDIGIAAAIGCRTLPVRRRVRVAVLSFGDELADPAEAPDGAQRPGSIYDSNRHMIIAALGLLGADVTDLGVVPDRRDAIRQALANAAAMHDMVISSGGMSAGAEDHVRPALLEIGTLDFWKLALRPGKPVAVGRIGDAAFIGLPGNPVSAMVCFCLIARALLLRLMGASDGPVQPLSVFADFGHCHPRGRREYLRVRVRPDGSGHLRATAYRSSSSAMLSSLVWSDGLAEILETHADVVPGDVIGFLPYTVLLC